MALLLAHEMCGSRHREHPSYGTRIIRANHPTGIGRRAYAWHGTVAASVQTSFTLRQYAEHQWAHPAAFATMIAPVPNAPHKRRHAKIKTMAQNNRKGRSTRRARRHIPPALARAGEVWLFERDWNGPGGDDRAEVRACQSLRRQIFRRATRPLILKISYLFRRIIPHYPGRHQRS